MTPLSDLLKTQHHLCPFASFRPEGEIFKAKYVFQDAVLKKILSRTHAILIRTHANKACIIMKVEMGNLHEEKWEGVDLKRSFRGNVPNKDVGYEIDVGDGERGKCTN